MSSLVSKVTTDDTQPIPIYTLKELSELTQKSLKDSEVVRAALLSRLSKSSPDIKFKTLRSIKYICTNGCIDFKLAFQRENAMVKALVQFSCPPDDFRGDKPAENVRAEAQECMEAIYADHQTASGSIKVESMGNNTAAHHQSSQQQRGTSTYQGFGTPAPQKQDSSDSFTGLNLRKTISTAILGNSSTAPPQAPQSKYGGYSSNQYSSSTYSHYTHNPNSGPQQHQQQQQQQQHQQESHPQQLEQPPQSLLQPHQQQHHQQPTSGLYSGQGYSPNGVFGGGASAETYSAARQHGYETHNNSQNPYSNNQQNNSGLNKTGPWGSKGGNAANSFNQPQSTTAPQQHSHPHPHQPKAGIPNQPYTSRTGPTTRDSVEDLGFEKRIVSQFTSNTPLKPNLSDVELKKFTTDSSACAVDDILMILFDTLVAPSTYPVSLNKALQLYTHLVIACSMTADECQEAHLTAIQHLYQNTTNKHTKGHCEKVFVYLGFIEASDVAPSSQQVSGFVAQPQQFDSQSQQSQSQQQTAPVTNNDEKNSDVFDVFGSSTTTQQSASNNNNNNNDLSSSFGFMNIDNKPQSQQPPSATKKPMFSGLNVKPKLQQPQQQQQQQQQATSGSAFDFMGQEQQPPSQHQQSNDLFALLGTNPTPTKSGGLDLDSLYATSQPKVTQPSKQQDMFASMENNNQQNGSSFDFMTTTSSQRENDDVFGDLLTSAQTQPQPQPQVQPPAQKPASTNSFDFVDSMF